MLKISTTPHISLPHIDLGGSKPMQLSPVTDDSDELTQAVSADPVDHDDNWELTDGPDEAELDAFWTNVEKDIQKDPSWFTFD